jgi:hypothetical protein
MKENLHVGSGGRAAQGIREKFPLTIHIAFRNPHPEGQQQKQTVEKLSNG